MAIYKNTPPIVTSGLILYADPASRNSYVSGSLVMTNLNDATTGSFNVAPGYSLSNAGTIYFSGSVYTVLTFLTSSNFDTIQTNNSLTLSVWFKTPSTGNYRDVVGINKAAGNNPFCIRFNNSNNLFYDTTVGGTRYTPAIIQPLTINTWTHACVTFGNNLIVTYYNGIQANTQATSGIIKAFDSNQFGIGGSIGYGYFIGDISNFQLYNRALSREEVLQNYNATRGRFGL
jgi:hypothetical protein